MSQHRQRRLKQAKSPMTAAAWRFFLAPENTVHDYDVCVAECKVRPEAAEELLQFYYFAPDFKETWRDHKAEIQSEWAARFPDPVKREAHKRWALQCFQDRLRAKLMAERDATAIKM